MPKMCIQQMCLKIHSSDAYYILLDTSARDTVVLTQAVRKVESDPLEKDVPGVKMKTKDSLRFLL